jgi:biotin-dependent carboxylase-like uncharacterized protein
MSSIQIIQAGFYTTVQDGGRKGYAHLGVPESGAMDQEAYLLANVLLNNDDGAAVLECTLQGPEILFEADTYFVITGGSTKATLDDVPVVHGVVAFAKAKQQLRIGSILNGCRCYVGISGGVLSWQVMGSRSMYVPFTDLLLTKGTQLPIGTSNYGQQKGARIRQSESKKTLYPESITEITAYIGPEFSWLDSKQKQDILKSFTVSKFWNRMALQLEEQLPNTLKTMYTAPVLPGTVQWTPAGTFIVLLRDCQTTGGYPRVLQVSQDGLNRLSRLQKGDCITWKLLR